MRIHFYLLALTIFASSCVSFKPVEFQGIESLQMLEQNDTTAEVGLKVKIKNPNNFRLVVKKVELDAYLNKKLVGKVNHSEKLVVPRKSENAYDIRLKADMVQLQKLMPTMLFSGSSLVSVKGKVKGRALWIPKTIDIDISQKVNKNDLKF
ncbi:MAG: LEA type 2 family protein [Cytophagaceae bacterium]